jgi:hypothetical protein
MAPVLEGKSIALDQKTVCKAKLLIWGTKNQARDPGTLQLKDSICFIWTLDPRLKRFLGNRTLHPRLKRFLGNRTLGPRLKWAEWCFTARPFPLFMWRTTISIIDIWCKMQACWIRDLRP